MLPFFSSPEQHSRRAIVLPPASALALALAVASKILSSTIPTPMHDLKVKITDLELLC